MSESYLVIELNQQPVELCKLLKIANLVSGGGEAKVVISEGYVLLNGEVEYQKRKKVYHQDVIEFNGEVVQLIINESLAETSTEAEPVTERDSEHSNPTAKTKTAKKKANAKKNLAKKDANAAANQQENFQEKLPKKRRPISF
ncbi:MAG: RNA-binding S4 domain-containing protein [Colwellia sp.]|nr:RNA-binding S4 domain-containing protein [Colwellia sp.]